MSAACGVKDAGSDRRCDRRSGHGGNHVVRRGEGLQTQQWEWPRDAVDPMVHSMVPVFQWSNSSNATNITYTGNPSNRPDIGPRTELERLRASVQEVCNAWKKAA